MKIATLTPTLSGSVALAALFAVALTGCPTSDDSGNNNTGTDPTTSGPTSDSESETQPPETGSESGSVSDTDPSGSGTETSDPSTTTGDPPLEGPGCGITPVCDKGELVGSVQMESSDQIEEIAGYTSMTGWLEIFGTDLVCLDFLACLETVGHDVTIFDNQELQSVRGLSSLTAVGTFTAGEPLGDQDGVISIGQNNTLEDIGGFAALEKIQKSLSISENAALKRISGFANLVFIQADVNITFNPVLEELSGLSHLLALGNECIITNNESLCTSETLTVCGDLEQYQGWDDVPPAPFPPGNTANNKDGC